MKDPQESQTFATSSAEGFQISDKPVVQSDRLPAQAADASAGKPENASEIDLLYAVARDPKSLFLYWVLNWKLAFARARISARQVHLRVYREDGSVDGTHEINPFRGHCYVDVGAAGTGYYCELGCFNGRQWIPLIRSAKAVTPEDRISDDLSAQFATLPLHLKFQRLLEILRETRPESTTLARSVAALQENARALQKTTTPEEWSRLTKAAGISLNGKNGDHASDYSSLLESAKGAAPTADEIARWRQLGENLGGASWGGASHGGFGGSSPA
ncbi:MAG: DUF4912 domain-containing protein [Spartobacteria bacterium]